MSQPQVAVKQVLTKSGKTINRRDSRTINSEVYEVGTECVPVEGKWYAISSGKVVEKDGKWVIKEANLLSGFVFNEKGVGKLKEFKKNEFNTLLEDDARDFIEDTDDVTKYTDRNGRLIIPVENEFQLLKNAFDFIYPQFDDTYKTSKTSKVDTNQYKHTVAETDFTAIQKKHLKFIEKFFTPELQPFADLLTHSVGVEYETSEGYLTNSMCDFLGLIKLRDGSLKSGAIEYSTVPMEGQDALLSNLIIPEILYRQHNVDIKCSLHVHLGKYPTDKLSLITLWALCSRIQYGIFEFIPPYRKTKEFAEAIFLKEGKDYCAPLPPLSMDTYTLVKDSPEREKMTEFYANKIFYYLTSGRNPDSDFNFVNRKHPQQHKWERHARYSAFSLINLVFGEQPTFEARVHTATLNKYKIIAWIYFLNAVLEFAEKEQDRILNKDKIDIYDILAVYKEKGDAGKIMYRFLFDYIAERTEKFENHYSLHHKPYPYLEELKNDSTFVPKSVPNELKSIFAYSSKVAGGEV
jgi:hypothetical protein